MIYKINTTFLILMVLFACGEHKESITPEIKKITESVYASGIIKSKNQYEVFGKVNGIIETVFVEEGARVLKGESLFKFDNENSKLATENARLNSVTSDFEVNTDRLNEAKKGIELAKMKLTNDSLSYLRQKNLWDKNIGSKYELEQRELSYENSKVGLTNALVRYEDLKRQLKLASNQSKNNLKIAELQEDDLIVRSEIDGVIYQINKEQGEFSNNLSALAVIGADEFILELDIDEFDIVKIKKDQQVIVRMDSYDSEIFEAKITWIDKMMNSRTRSFKAEAIFTTSPPELFPNLTVEANIVIRTKQNTLTIPRNYLVNDSMVILADGTLQKVETGLMDYSLAEITGGITKDTKIVLPEK